MEVLILVAERNGPTMMARIGVMKALNRNVARLFSDRRSIGASGGIGELIRLATPRHRSSGLYFAGELISDMSVARHCP